MQLVHLIEIDVFVPLFPPHHDPQEDDSEQHVADIGVNVIEVAEEAQRISAQEVVVAQVLVARVVEHLLVGDDQLDGGQPVEEGDREHVPQVRVGLFLENPRVLPREVAQVNDGLLEHQLPIGGALHDGVVLGFVQGDVGREVRIGNHARGAVRVLFDVLDRSRSVRGF